MLSAIDPRVISSSPEGNDMGRRRLQRKGYLIKKSGSWLGRWREYALDGSSVQKSRVIAPAVGPEAINRRAADRLFWNEILSKLDQRVTHLGSTMTLRQFIEMKFQVQVIDKRKPSTIKHYRYILGGFVLPALGHKRLCDVRRDDVETLVARTLKEYSVQLAVHIRNCISRIFNHAEALDCYPGKNPARGVECGELKHAHRPTLTLSQANRALTALPSPYKEMAWLAIETSMHAAELCGLRRCWVNLTANFKQTDGEILPPYTVAVRENWYEGKRGSLKTGKRRRLCPITEQLAAEMTVLILKSQFQGDDMPVFCSVRGSPIDAHNARSRIFVPISKKLGFEIAWHAFRRAHSTFAGQIDGISVEDRMRTMGHADADMTLYYSVDDINRRRPIPSKIRDRITAAESANHSADQTSDTVQ